MENRGNVLNVRPHRHYNAWMPFTTNQRNRTVNIQQELPSNETEKVEVAGFRQLWNNETSLWKRLLWLMSSSAILSVCIYQMCERVEHFLLDESAVNVVYQSNKTIELPTLTFCFHHFMEDLPQLFSSSFKHKQFFIKSYDDVDKLLLAGNITVYDMFNLTNQYWAKLEIAVYNPYKYKWHKFDSFHVREIYTYLGLCHSIDFEENLINYGPDTAIQLMWFKGLVYNRHSSRVIMHAKDFLFWKYAPEMGTNVKNWVVISVPSYFRQTIKFEQQVLRRRTKNNHCVEGKHITECMAACVKKISFQYLPKFCRIPGFEILSEYPYCRSLGELQVVLSLIEHIASSVCRPDVCKCSAPCREVSFSVTNSEIDFPRIDKAPARILCLTFNANTVQLIKEEIGYNWFNLLCDLGGTLGFWLGICGMDILKIVTFNLRNLQLHVRTNRSKSNLTVARRRPYAIVIRSTLKTAHNSNESAFSRFLQHAKKWMTVLVRNPWIILFSAAACLNLYQIMERVSYYLSSPSVTNVYDIDDENTVYPVITICPESNGSFLPAMNKILMQELHGKEMSFTAILHSIEDGRSKLEDVWNASRIVYKNLSLMSESGPYDEMKVTEFDSILGTCTTVTAKPNMEKLNRFSWQKLCFVGEDDGMIYFRVILHHPDDISILKYLAKSRGHRKYKYFEMEARVLEIVESNYINSPTRPCSTRQVVNHCISKCIEAKIYSTAKKTCRLPYMRPLEHLPVCTTKSDIELMINSTLSALKTFDLEACCCPRYCKDVVYSKRYDSGSQYNHPRWDAFCIQVNGNLDRFPMVQEEAAYSSFSLFCDLGGVVGLFLGLSGVQLVQIVISLKATISAYFKTKAIPVQTNHQSRRRVIIVRDETKKIKSNVSDVEIPGFEEVMKKDNVTWIRILWLLISVLFLGISIYQCAQQISYYMKDPSEVIIFQRCNRSVFFPLITFCPDANDFLSAAEFAIKRKANQEHFSMLEIWNISKQNIFHSATLVAYESSTLIPLEVYTSRGICFVLKRNDPVVVTGKPDIFIEYHTPINYNAAVSSVYPLEDYIKIQYSANSMFASKPMPYSPQRMHLSMEVREMHFRNVPQKPCTDAETVAKCYADCIEKRIYSVTNRTCRMPFMQESSLRACDTYKDWQTVMTNLQFLDKLPIDVPENCNCPRKCILFRYLYRDYHTSYYEANARHLTTAIPNNCITLTQEKPAYTFFKLLSDLGGIFGLYFGLGMLQIKEIIVFNLLTTRTYACTSCSSCCPI